MDKKPRTDTRNVALGHPDCAYNYALDVDKKPRTDTRKAVLNDPSRAYNYALHVDKKPRADTRKAVKRTFWAAHYKRWENSLPAAVHNSKSALNSDHLADIKPRTDIKNSAFADPFFAYFYAQKIDGKPRQETRSAVLGTRWEIPYKKWEDSLQKDVEQS